MKWKKLGLIIKPGITEWMHTHAQNPFVESLKDDLIKVHFSTRDRQNQAQGAYAILSINNPDRVIEYSSYPTVGIGELGAFDDCGAMPSCIVAINNKHYMYYTGWTKAVKTPFSFFIGLLESYDKGTTYQRVSRAPIVGRSSNDPFMTAMPWILVENGTWRMWYVSCSGWEAQGNEKPKHFYRICYAESKDGISWKTDGKICIDYGPDEYAFGRPYVQFSHGFYSMWFSYRGAANSYRIGYAESRDGLNWVREDKKAEIECSSSGWDSEMICYPSLFQHSSKTYMLYNGNSYGRDGAGLAVLEI